LGLALVGAAVWAPQLGLDTNKDWGPSRKLLFAAGAVVVLLAWIRVLFARATAIWRATTEGVLRLATRIGLGTAFRRWGSAWESSIVATFLRRVTVASRRAWGAVRDRSRLLSALFGTREARVAFADWTAFAVVALSYLWYVSVGTWVHFRGPSAYQDMQAEAFLRGQTYLLREPEQDLLTLADPYDPAEREGVVYLWDASLYQGHYYLYWGPVPALLLMPVKAIADVRVGDDVLVFLFSVGSLFWATRLLLRLWADHFRAIPGWVVVGSVAAVGWANPATWLLNSPWIYESAIAGGQFFLLMGFNAVYPLLGLGRGGALDLLGAGASFALAVGTRSSLAPAVAGVAFVILMRLRQVTASSPRRLGSWGLPFILPLIVGAAILAGYNQIRFGSPLEFGHRYQLTSLELAQATGDITSLRNVPPNLYNYLVNPVRLLPVFPYVKPRWGGTYMSVLRLHAPQNYYSRQITGLLLASPLSLFSLVAIARLVRRRSGPALADVDDRRDLPEGASWVVAALALAALLAFALVQIYLVATMRYLGDFTPGLMILAVVGYWSGLATRLDLGKHSAAYGLLGLFLLAWTAAAGLLLGVTSYHARFEKLNPALFRWLESAFTF
jgi:hypothetical protein